MQPAGIMIEWALREVVESSIIDFVRAEDVSELLLDELTDDDWNMMARVKLFLQRFHDLTMK